ncbi:pyridoxal-phosphate dependent enzyme [Nonomuraea spiralis]|uniref:Pyridoxal-phosphate dependent enzyme n=1 Tax=Nonomuraea spiralis TaxID=46182 RepID=A0ABV5IS75_9ACTN|nr:pyridoxal-phosphate dependent enzyme [Nonomuraea spiralis]GGT24316.1 hypothetical protein GCM10010176_081130 [Nonomuraea spiralis]
MSWSTRALDTLAAGPPTRLIDFPVRAPGVRLLLKDESGQPTGSLRHRHARALFRQAVLDGLVTEGTTVVEATGGNAAVAQAWFARRLGLPYIVVMPGRRDQARARAVEALGGECRFVTPPLAIYDAARSIEGHFLDQFGRAAPHDSAYFPGWTLDVPDYATGMPSRIEGIGRPRVEPGFRPDLVDLVVPVPDAASVAAARHLREVTGLPVGGSSGTALWAALELVERMRARGESGTVVSLVGDAAERHLATYHDDAWAAGKGLDVAGRLTELRQRV